MDHVLVRKSNKVDLMRHWLKTTPDGDLFDSDILNHESTFILEAFNLSGVMGFLPVQQPLMLENLIYRPGLTIAETAQVTARLAEHAVEEAYNRDAGEAYFLCRDQSTLQYAERRNFIPLPSGLQVRRLNLRETFGA